MTTSKELFERSLKVAPGGVHSPVRAFKSVGGTPVFFQSAEGPYLYSVEGKKYVDFCQSFGPLILGHRDPDVTKVVEHAVHTAWSFGTCEPYSLELAEWILKELPSHIQKIRFVNSGTEAVMSALRVARAATGKSKIVKFEGCYHGHLDSLLVKAGSGLAGLAAADSAGVSMNTASDTLVCRLNDIEALENLFKNHHQDIAAVILEPLPANYGLLEQSTEFITQVYNTAKKYSALVIFDEVISGFRVGMQGMAGKLGLAPDLVTYGKIIGGGFPVGAYAARSELMDLVAPAGPVYQAGTLSANPIGMQAGLATLKKVKEQNVYKVLKQRTDKFVGFIRQELTKANSKIQISSYESLFWLHLKTKDPIRRVDEIPGDTSKVFARLFHACLEKGVYLSPSGFEVNFTSLAHTDEVLHNAGVRIVEACLAAE